MNKKRFISLALLFLFTISVSSCVTFAQNDGDHSYSIPYADIDLFVEENGNLHVKEKLHYSFTGTYHGVYRDIPLKSGEIIKNLKISAHGAYSTYNVTDRNGMKRITVYLYSNSQKTVPITDNDVDVFIEYDFINVIKIYNDVAELHYKLWGEDWDVDVGQVNSNIHLQSSKGVKYWLNPPYFVKNINWQGETLQMGTKKIPLGKYFEVRMAIPKDQFITNAPFAQKISINELPVIERIQQEYENSLNFKTDLYSVLSLIMVLSIFLPVFIYFRFGREPKIDYNAKYERDLPTDDPPAVVNAICGGFSKKVGKPNLNGFKATIMDLINCKYLLIEDIPSKLDKNKEYSLSLKINENKNIDELNYFEIDVINFLNYFEENNVIHLAKIKEDLKRPIKGILDLDPETRIAYEEKSIKVQITALRFRDSYNCWKADLESEFLDDETMNQIFIKKGDKHLKIFGGVGLTTAAITFLLTAFDPLPAANYALLSSIILGLVAICSLVIPQKIAGQWTTYGEEYNLRWNNFAKYIQDFSLIREYPPESVEIWDKYLVYATALGIADEVRKSMEMIFPSDKLAQSTIYMFHYYGGYTSLSSGLSASINAPISGVGGGGGAGGGAGGGGGGAF